MVESKPRPRDNCLLKGLLSGLLMFPNIRRSESIKNIFWSCRDRSSLSSGPGLKNVIKAGLQSAPGRHVPPPASSLFINLLCVISSILLFHQLTGKHSHLQSVFLSSHPITFSASSSGKPSVWEPTENRSWARSAGNTVWLGQNMNLWEMENS